MFEQQTRAEVARQGSWHRIERLGRDGRVLDYVEVGQCRDCGRGVDRIFPEWREVDGAIVCVDCAPAVEPRQVPGFLRLRGLRATGA